MTLEEVLEESWTFQEIKKEAHEEGRQEGCQEGMQAQRHSLILLIQKYYPALLQLAQDVCHGIRTLEELQDLFQKILQAESEQEVHQILLGTQK